MVLKRYNYKNFSESGFKELFTGRFSINTKTQENKDQVQKIIEEVRIHGDEALRTFSKKWDGLELSSLSIGAEELKSLSEKLGEKEREAIHLAYTNIHKFHKEQIQTKKSVETMPGVLCWKEARPLDRIGLYIPGGSAPLLSTFLMLGIPAILAGVKEIIVCTPGQKNGDTLHPAIAYIAGLFKLEKVFTVGGAQAIAAMALGTESIPKVNKIFGPGNAYVTLAKQILQTESHTAIDMPAGPSEVLIIGNKESNPVFIASDLLAQAEHGADSQVVLVSTHEELIQEVERSIEDQMKNLNRKETAQKALENSYAVLVENELEAIQFSNAYAPEHLILSLNQFEPLLKEILNAGSVFLGPYSPESAGDYASGTNHTLPTSGYAKMYSGVSVESFQKNISFQSISKLGLSHLAPAIEILAEMEGLDAHANSVRVRAQAEKK